MRRSLAFRMAAADGSSRLSASSRMQEIERPKRTESARRIRRTFSPSRSRAPSLLGVPPSPAEGRASHQTRFENKKLQNREYREPEVRINPSKPREIAEDESVRTGVFGHKKRLLSCLMVLGPGDASKSISGAGKAGRGAFWRRFRESLALRFATAAVKRDPELIVLAAKLVVAAALVERNGEAEFPQTGGDASPPRVDHDIAGIVVPRDRGFNDFAHGSPGFNAT